MSIPQSRAKRRGTDFERIVVKLFHAGGVEARRSGGAGQIRGDVDLPEFPKIVVECKSRPRDLLRAIREGLEQTAKKTDDESVGVVVCRRSGKAEPVVVMTITDFCRWLAQ